MKKLNSTKSIKMQEKRQKILECSLVLFAEKGYLNTPVRDIIDSSGFGTSTFYKYFKNKEDVLKTLLTEFLEQIITNVKDYYKKEEDLFIRFIETKRVIMDVFIQNKQLSEIYSRVAGISDGIDNCLKEFEDKLLLFTSKNIQYGIKQGFFHEVEVVPIAHGIIGIIKYAVYKWVVLKEISQDEMIEMVISFHKSLAIGLVKKR
ncbi:TetR/AcrR family transcriptional regulator [Desulfoscipio gibsoniae]|uniref:TetR/AcrR family transcriptional regulator n=1 Tax=Desulfoscipio gibsoniae TaxID=102134 RepID=UPI003EB893D7